MSTTDQIDIWCWRLRVLPVLAIGGLLATACQQTPAFEGNEADTSTDAIVVNRATSELPPVPIALPTLGRRDLIAAAAAARDATASGRDLPNANKELVDRAFEIRLPVWLQRARTG